MACCGLGFYGGGEGVGGAAGALAAAGESLTRLVIARETVAEVLDAEADFGQRSDVSGLPGAAVRGSGRDVALYERITRVFSEAGAALRLLQVCEALGMSTEARFIEAMRPKLSRLVADGVLVQVGPGLFAPVGWRGERDGCGRSGGAPGGVRRGTGVVRRAGRRAR